MKSDYILGVDLGQAQDFTAIRVLERTPHDTGRTVTRRVTMSRIVQHSTLLDYPPVDRDPQLPDPSLQTTPVLENHYAVRHLERLPIGTPYPAQVARIKELMGRLSETPLVVDQTGVGRAVVDMLRAAQLKPVPVTITGGDSVHRTPDGLRVPKRDLVAAVQVLLQGERLKIARSLKEAQTLTAELLAFKVNISLSGHDSYGDDKSEWRENLHDDLVLAVALAAWYGERHRKA